LGAGEAFGRLGETPAEDEAHTYRWLPSLLEAGLQLVSVAASPAVGQGGPLAEERLGAGVVDGSRHRLIARARLPGDLLAAGEELEGCSLDHLPQPRSDEPLADDVAGAMAFVQLQVPPCGAVRRNPLPFFCSWYPRIEKD
jgi:hypothetical protein